jgi:SAM-dependent methyltransferase
MLVGTHQCYGIELNSEAAAEAAAKGITILSLDSLEGVTAMQFDVVMLIDVFEHLAAPLILLRRLFGRLRESGVLIIVTGNGDFPLCRMDPGQFWYFRTIQHVCMLTKRHALFLEQELGARIKQWQEISHYDTSLLEKFWQSGRHFAYWQFRNNTFLARIILQFVPLLRRARCWKTAPALTYGRDHVMVVFGKDTACRNSPGRGVDLV